MSRGLYWKSYSVLSRVLSTLNHVPVGQRSLRVGPDRLYADSIDRWLALLSWKLGAGERQERALIAREVRGGMVAVDVGANVGLHVLGLARATSPGGQVHAFEPDPDNFRLLSRAVREAAAEHVRLHQAAASDRAGQATLYVSDANRGDHRLAPAEEARRSITVPSVVLDEVLAGEPHVDFVKIDVQGAEVAVLRGLNATLTRNRGIQVLCELCPELLRRAGTSSGEFFACFHDSGFRPHRIAPDGTCSPVSEEDATREAEAAGYVNLHFRRASP